MRFQGSRLTGMVAVGAMGVFTLSTAGNMAAKAVKQHHYKQKLKVSPQCIECAGKGRMSCDICQDSKMIECHNEVFLRARQIVVCPGCGGQGDRDCPNCYGEGVNTAAA